MGIKGQRLIAEWVLQLSLQTSISEIQLKERGQKFNLYQDRAVINWVADLLFVSRVPICEIIYNVKTGKTPKRQICICPTSYNVPTG